MTGDYPAAAASARKALTLMRGLGHRIGEADALRQLGVVQRDTGDYPSAANCLTQTMALYRELGHRAFHAMSLNDLGMVQQLTGNYAAAAASATSRPSNCAVTSDRSSAKPKR